MRVLGTLCSSKMHYSFSLPFAKGKKMNTDVFSVSQRIRGKVFLSLLSGGSSGIALGIIEGKSLVFFCLESFLKVFEALVGALSH